ncbi:MAG: glycerol-3-phosphate acyltransferase [Planctomycetota bacterium]
MVFAVACLVAFLLGAVPFALLVVRVVKGVDVRTVGSGNVGATNASRAFASAKGRTAAFVAIYLLDAAKGFAPALLGPQFVAEPRLVVGTACGAAAVLGHVFTPFLGFRGGKGVATATGVLFALDWQATAIAMVVFLVVRWCTGQVFFGSLALGLALAAAAMLLHLDTAFAERLPVTMLCCLLALLLFWTHRSNLKKHFSARAAGSA